MAEIIAHSSFNFAVHHTSTSFLHLEKKSEKFLTFPIPEIIAHSSFNFAVHHNYENLKITIKRRVQFVIFVYIQTVIEENTDLWIEQSSRLKNTINCLITTSVQLPFFTKYNCFLIHFQWPIISIIHYYIVYQVSRTLLNLHFIPNMQLKEDKKASSAYVLVSYKVCQVFSYLEEAHRLRIN